MKSTKKLTVSALVIAIYIIVMFLTQSIAFGPIQARIATGLYGLGYLYPFLIIPMGLANFLSNTLLGGLGIYDMIGGTIVGILTTAAVYLVRRLKLNPWFILIPIIFIPGLIVPLWLSTLVPVQAAMIFYRPFISILPGWLARGINTPYGILALSLCLGQVIPAFLGVFLVKKLENKDI